MERKRRFRKPDGSQHQWYKDQKYIVKQIIQKLMVVSKLKAVYVFIYLKSKLSLQNPDLTDITVRPGKACSAFHKLKKKNRNQNNMAWERRSDFTKAMSKQYSYMDQNVGEM